MSKGIIIITPPTPTQPGRLKVTLADAPFEKIAGTEIDCYDKSGEILNSDDGVELTISDENACDITKKIPHKGKVTAVPVPYSSNGTIDLTQIGPNRFGLDWPGPFPFDFYTTPYPEQQDYPCKVGDVIEVKFLDGNSSSFIKVLEPAK
jgi:hypothetical protein